MCLHLRNARWKNTKFLGCGIADCHDPDTNAPFKVGTLSLLSFNRAVH